MSWKNKACGLFLTLSLAGVALGARGRSACDGFLPPNDLRIPVGSLEANGISEAQFNQVLDQVQALYGPIIAARGGRLVINRLWSDSTVNASAERNGGQRIINMYGGLARHDAITQDGLALVACHELGHHLGGAPKFGIFERLDWASNEGQSDYFANLKCLRPRCWYKPPSEEPDGARDGI